ncbi:MAG: hypothetical protein JHC24_01210 [Thaumarchaeota archaeon]|nr:hypothetical protein [Nitrososphaerota archaeon]
MGQLDKDRVLKSSTEDLIRELGTDLQRGLTSADAEGRLSRYGPNEVREAQEPPEVVRRQVLGAHRLDPDGGRPPHAAQMRVLPKARRSI